MHVFEGWARGFVHAVMIALLLAIASIRAIGATEPGPTPPPDSIDVSKLQLTFEDRFTELSVWSPTSPGRWYPHTPWHGDFGDAEFVYSRPQGPFLSGSEGLSIEARQSGGKWTSGLLASVDPKGHGFAQRYGYFEVRAKLPPGPGVWPSFWLDSFVEPGSQDPSLEVDVFEYYGAFPGFYHSVTTLWPRRPGDRKFSDNHVLTVPPGLLSEGFHTFGALVSSDWIVFYRDRKETWRTPTPPEHRHKLMVLVDLALGGGWPINETPSPSRLEIEYIRAYALPGAPE